MTPTRKNFTSGDLNAQNLDWQPAR